MAKEEFFNTQNLSSLCSSFKKGGGFFGHGIPVGEITATLHFLLLASIPPAQRVVILFLSAKRAKRSIDRMGGGIIDYAPFCEQEAGKRRPALGKDVNYGSLCSS
jgi:hypothetical protein